MQVVPRSRGEALLGQNFAFCYPEAYTERFMLRLDEPSQAKLEQLITQFGASKAEIIRQLIAQAKPEHFSPSWHLTAAERRGQQAHRTLSGPI
jgi:hypothetical protein